ncbi:MAG: pirin family protein [Amphritea sp.]
MIQIRRSADRGFSHFGWLESRHTFSFGSYFDPQQMGISELRVVNEDKVQPSAGLDPNTHQDIEIISYIIDGKALHKDSLGNQKILEARSIQLLSAGTGVEFSEQNPSVDKALHLMQIWIVPNTLAAPPSYQSAKVALKEGLSLLISPDGRENSLQINQQVCAYQLKLKNTACGLPEGNCAFLHVIKGELEVNGSYLQPGDGALFEDEPFISVRTSGKIEALYFTLP